MIHASDRVANMDVHLRSQISLPLRRELPQIMPQSSKIPPIASCSCLCRAGRKHLTSKLRTPVSDLVQMSMISIQPSTFFAILLLALIRSEEHTSELQSRGHLVCRLLLEKKNYL